jgi:hypothetical protein
MTETLLEEIKRGKKEFRELVAEGYKKPRDWPAYKSMILWSKDFFNLSQQNDEIQIFQHRLKNAALKVEQDQLVNISIIDGDRVIELAQFVINAGQKVNLVFTGI